MSGSGEEARTDAARRSGLGRAVVRGAVAVGVLVAILAAVLIVRTLRLSSRQPQVEPAELVAVDADRAAERLAGALRFQTVSVDGERTDLGPLEGLRAHLEASFPHVHQELDRQVIDGASLLYTWRGGDPTRDAILLLAHLDVVPVDGSTAAEWQEGAFSGTVRDGFIWGRGAMDDKGPLMAILEAVELLLAEGFTPAQTIYLAFGHDEEIGGNQGAAAIARRLGDLGVRAELVLDEGLAITHGIMKGMDSPVALIGIAEKGFVNVELVARGEGGHSSMPPRSTAVGILARAIGRIESRPLDASIEGPVRQTLDFVAPEMSFANRLVMANLWLFGSVVKSKLAAESATDALIRTTTAPTMLAGSEKANVLPRRARAVINFRIRPGQTSADVLAHVRRVVADPRVEVQANGEFASEPSPTSSTSSRAFSTIQQTVRQLDTSIVVAPGLVVGATDSRHFADLAADIYRFAPMRVTRDDLSRVHGLDERLAVHNYVEMIMFYSQLIRNASSWYD